MAMRFMHHIARVCETVGADERLTPPISYIYPYSIVSIQEGQMVTYNAPPDVSTDNAPTHKWVLPVTHGIATMGN